MKLKERLLWTGGRVFHILPPGIPITIPTGINKGFRWVRGHANAPEWMGIYERSKQMAVSQFNLRGKTVFDVGANAGFYTLAFSRLVGPKGNVFAFEPLGRNCDKLLNHLTLNGIENAKVVQCAVADCDGFTAFQIGNSDFAGKLATSGRHVVPVFSLDSITERLTHQTPYLVKIDVEGAEAEVLKGADKVLAKSRPKLLIAIHGQERASKCFAILQSYGYSMETLTRKMVKSADEMGDEILAVPLDFNKSGGDGMLESR